MNPLLPARRLPAKRKALLRRTTLTIPRYPYPSQPQLFRQQHTYPSSPSRLPRFVQPSVWNSIIPRFLRERTTTPVSPKKPSTSTAKPSNPSTYFIWIYILIGSQAIRILGLKHSSTNYSRQADLKLAKLRDVIEKLHKGEEVDVEKVLGTGDETAEREWEEALMEVQREERMWQDGSKKRREERERKEREGRENSPVNTEGEGNGAHGEIVRMGVVPNAPGFY